MPEDQCKPCSKCGEVKALSEFSPHKQCRYGVRPDCKTCVRARAHARREADPEGHKARTKAYYWKHVEKNRTDLRERYAADPEKARRQKRESYARVRLRTDHETPAEKRCPSCERTLPSSEYRRRRSAWDGLSWACRDCRNAQDADSYERHRDSRRARSREAQRARWASMSPEQRRLTHLIVKVRTGAAKGEVDKALRSGALVRGPCAVGKGCRGRVEGHHKNYNEPLSVEWLCRRHHMAWHRGNDPVYVHGSEAEVARLRAELEALA
jgi:hypothetical protein